MFVVLAALACCSAARGGAGEKPQLWLYWPANLAVDKNIDELRTQWQRCAALGYDHVLLTDSKFAKLGDMDRHYFANVDKVKQVGRQLKMEIVPALFDVGYSNNLLWHDP